MSHRPTRRTPAPLASAALAVCVLAGSANAQGAPEQSGQRVSITDAFAAIAKAEPQRRAGLRADLIRRTQQTVPVVVIVTDAPSYLAAVEGWEGVRRYPVLWDDGSIKSREDIARFVRAFQPEHVVRYVPDAGAPGWPAARADRQKRFRETLAHALDDHGADFQGSLQTLRDGGIVSPGIVLTDVDDQAWPAALALCAARLQPVAFIDTPGSVWRPLNSEQCDVLEQAAEHLARDTGLEWRTIGDDIDAVTLCMNTSVKLAYGPNDHDIYAVSARVGRFGDNGTGDRWANTGQLFGSYSQSVYRAMCAIFLDIRDAFVFDGYDATQPWNAYDGTEASGVLKSLGMEVQLHDLPNNTRDLWLAMTARPIRPALWLINSHGTQNEINMQMGKVRGTDVPLLEHPAVVHIVHSFSAALPANRVTVAGAMLDRGVYAMLGSVDEPYLSAFVPTPLVARRLAGGMNFAAAVRFDDVPVWKLAVMGDPLVTLGPAGARVPDATPDLPGTPSDLDKALTDALASKDIPRAVETLTLLGRDHDAARLASAAINDKQTAVSPELAAAAIPALFRDGRHEDVLTAFANLTDDQRSDPVLGDCFWFAGRFLLASSPDRDRVERLMRLYQRPDSLISDAEEIAMTIRRRSIEDAVVFLESIRPRLTKDWEFRSLDSALNRVRAGTP